jgi:alpha-tubulin suppressor-like RCC1 family protein
MNDDKNIIEKVIEVVDDKEKKRRKPFWFWFVGGSVIVAAIGVLGFITLSNPSSSSSLSPTSNSVPTSSNSSSSSTPSSSSTTPSSSSSAPSSTAPAPIVYDLPTSLIQQTDLGWRSSFALSVTNRLFAWGLNDQGQLGDGTKTTRNNPIDITASFTFVSDEKIIVAYSGNKHSAALTSSGSVWTWGSNTNGQLGDDTKTQRLTPTNITSKFNLSEGEKVVHIALGKTIDGNHSAAYTSLGRVFVWGQNTSGQLGDGTEIDRSVPTDITSSFAFQTNETIVDLQLGNNHKMLWTSLGRVFAWGLNANGQLGNNTTITATTPIEITDEFDLAPGEKVSSVRLGSNFSTAITSNNRVFLWGGATSELNSPAMNFTIGQKIPFDITNAMGLGANDHVVAIRVGHNHVGVITKNDQVWIWGNNQNGKLGNNSTTNSSIPVDITTNFNLENGEKIIELSLGLSHTSAITNLGRFYIWGQNNNGQLGNGTTTDALLPILLNNK